jgi:hypothetical protein
MIKSSQQKCDLKILIRRGTIYILRTIKGEEDDNTSVELEWRNRERHFVLSFKCLEAVKRGRKGEQGRASGHAQERG